MIYTQCNNKFEGQRSTAKFCSDKCKLAYHRKEVSVSEEPLSVSKPEENDTVKVSVSEKKVKTLKDFGYSLKDLGVKWAPEGEPRHTTAIR